MKTMFKLSLSLAAYAVVACVGLAFVYQATSPLIAAAAERETQAALKVVFPEASSFEASSKIDSGAKNVSFDKAYYAKSGDAVIGMVVQVTGPTYASSTIVVGVDSAGILKPIRFLANTDTPGLGTKTALSPFVDQFALKSASDDFKVGADIAAISGATISSKAVANLVKLAAAAAKAALPAPGLGEPASAEN